MRTIKRMLNDKKTGQAFTGFFTRCVLAAFLFALAPAAGLGAVSAEAATNDVYAINRNGSSATTEIHVINGANPGQFGLQTATILGATAGDDRWEFDVADYNRDGVLDIYAINRKGSSNKTEIHIINGANAGQFLYQMPTVLGATDGDDRWEFKVADYNRDGVPDIYAINRKGSSNKTEIHIINGANPGQFLCQIATVLGSTEGEYKWEFDVADYNRDGVADIYAINRKGSSNKTDIHIINGASPGQFLYQMPTALGPTEGDGRYEFGVADYNRDGVPDIYVINRKGASNKTELHIINGANPGRFLLQTATALGVTAGDERWSFCAYGAPVVDQKTIQRQAVVNTALAQLGKPYIWGAEGPNSFDCSGLVDYAYRVNGLKTWTGRLSTATLVNQGINVKGQTYLPGDLVFPSRGHVMIYIGNNQCVEAPDRNMVVRVKAMPSNPYAVRRIIY